MDATETRTALMSLRDELEWLDRVEVEFRDDSNGEPGVFIQLVASPGERALFENGEQLADARSRVRRVLDQLGVDAWPFVTFASVDELAA